MLLQERILKFHMNIAIKADLESLTITTGRECSGYRQVLRNGTFNIFTEFSDISVFFTACWNVCHKSLGISSHFAWPRIAGCMAKRTAANMAGSLFPTPSRSWTRSELYQRTERFWNVFKKKREILSEGTKSCYVLLEYQHHRICPRSKETCRVEAPGVEWGSQRLRWRFCHQLGRPFFNLRV